MLLTSAEIVRAEIGFDDMVDINKAIDMALNAAESLIAATLGTTFERKSVSDVFVVSEPVRLNHGRPMTDFRLRAGFLAEAPIVTVDGVDISDKVRVDRERGIVSDWTTNYAGEVVAIDYVCGFESEMVGTPAEPTGRYVLEQVPNWLQTAAKLKALLLMAKLPALTEAGVQLDMSQLDAQYAALINAHIRYAPLAVLPD